MTQQLISLSDGLSRLSPAERERFVASLSPEESMAVLAEVDPCAFAEQAFGVTLYPKQREFVEAVFTEKARRVAVVGCNSSGKDFTNGQIIIPLWLYSYRPSKVVIYAPTHHQVAQIVWLEVRQAYNAAAERGYSFGPPPLQTPRWSLEEDHFAIGFSTDNPMNIQGFHSPNLLVVITEAHNVDQANIDALKRLNPRCIVMTGNAFADRGEFYDAFHDRGDLYRQVRIRAADTPNVIECRTVIPGLIDQDYIDDRRQEWGEDNPIYRASIDAEFTDTGGGGVVPIAWLRAATVRGPDLPTEFSTNPRPTQVLGVDVARFGLDKTVVVKRDGDCAEILWRAQGMDTQQVAGWVVRYMQDNPAGGTVVVDDTGVGGGVTDRLNEEIRTFRNRWRVVAFVAGANAYEQARFVNAIAECWWRVREWLDPSKASAARLPDDAALLGQGAGRRYSNDGRGRIKLESKDEMAARGRHSPDEFDALAMTFAPGATASGTVAGTGVWL